jgi:hypothetical protein
MTTTSAVTAGICRWNCGDAGIGRGIPVRQNGGRFGTSELPVHSTLPERFGHFSSARLPGGAHHQDPTEEVQVKYKGNNEYQAPPSSRIAEHDDDYSDPNCQQQPDHQR